MAIYHFTTHTMSRANGHSAVAAAAYRSASKLVDERTGEVCDFTRKGGVISAEIVTPEGVPVPARSDLWNAAEAAEKRKDSRVAREWLAAGEWVRQEIKRKSAPQVSITGRETDGNGAEQAQKKPEKIETGF